MGEVPLGSDSLDNTQTSYRKKGVRLSHLHPSHAGTPRSCRHSGVSLLTPTPASDPEKLHRIFIEYMIIQIILLVSPTGVARQAPP